MKNILFLLLFLFSASTGFAADVKISQLPLGAASATGINDSYPFVFAATNTTKRMTIWDIANIPTIVATYAPKASPVFTGTVTAPTFIGNLTGNATTATALAANPTDCTAGQYATAIAANGNLTCAIVASSQISGTVGVSQGGTGLTSGTSGGILGYTATGTIASSSLLTANQILIGGGAGVLPSALAAGSQYQVLRMGASNPAYGSIDLSQSAAVTGVLGIANGGSNSTATATAGGVGYGTGTAHAYTSAGTTGQFLKSNGSSAPAFATFAAPTIQKFTSGSGTYTTPTSPAPIYIRVRMVGGGGGGAGSGSGGGSGTGGGASTFGTTLLSAGGGLGGSLSGGNTGGSSSLGTGPIGTALTGSGGNSGGYTNTGQGACSGGNGGSSAFGGGGIGGGGQGTAQAGSNGSTNTGGGGGGASVNNAASGAPCGGGGGSGGFVDAIISSPSATYAYAVGATGGGGGAGTGGAGGGAGAAGYIEVTEYYQ